MSDTFEIVVMEWAPNPLELVEAAKLTRRTREMDPVVMREYALEYGIDPDIAVNRTPTRLAAPQTLEQTAEEWERSWRNALR